MTAAALRKRIMEAAEALASSGRLSHASQVFDLALDDLDRATADPFVDLRSLAAQNIAFIKRLLNIKEFPRVIDSRGRILRPPKKEAHKGELAALRASVSKHYE